MNTKTNFNELAKINGLEPLGDEFAEFLNSDDQLAYLRNEFVFPKMEHLPGVDLNMVDGESDSIYLCGHSLGLQPKNTSKYVERELEKWGKMGVHGHFHGDIPWAQCDAFVTKENARIVGATENEVAVMNGLSVNLHLLMVSFYRPTTQKHKILIEANAFPADRFIIESQIRFHGYCVENTLIFVQPRTGQETIEHQDIIETIVTQGHRIALVMFSAVNYYTGQLFNIPDITTAAKKKDCSVGWDLSNAAGNVPLRLPFWDVDFAAWCSYKYLNSSCGGLSSIFVHRKHATNTFPKFSGWWSDEKKHGLQVTDNLQLTPGAAGYRISTPPVLLVCPMLASLEIFSKTSMEELREKSIKLTGYLEFLIDEFFGQNSKNRKTDVFIKIVTPGSHTRRGCMLSLKFSIDLKQMEYKLKKRGVVCDVHLPNVLRVAPVPLYNNYTDVRKFVDALIKCIEDVET